MFKENRQQRPHYSCCGLWSPCHYFPDFQPRLRRDEVTETASGLQYEVRSISIWWAVASGLLMACASDAEKLLTSFEMRIVAGKVNGG